MKQLREPLLLVAIAGFFAFLPLPQVALPACVSLALSTRVLLGTRMAPFAGRQLAWAQLAFVLACAFPLLASLGLLLLAGALANIAEAAVLERCALWMRGLRVLLAAWFVVGCSAGPAALPLGFLATSCFAFLVLRMRSEVTLPDAR